MIHRIRRRSEFACIQSSGLVVRKGRVWIRFAPIECEHPRVAYALGRKNGSAVDRNRIRRQFRERVHMFDLEEGLSPGLYLIGLQGTDKPTLAHLSAALSSASSKMTAVSSPVAEGEGLIDE